MIINPFQVVPSVLTDPYFAFNGLLLAGDSTTDLSTFGHVPNHVGAGITFDATIPNGVYGSTAIRCSGAGDCLWDYSAHAAFLMPTIFTLDFDVWFGTAAANWVYLAASDFARFLQAIGGGLGVNHNVQGNYTARVLPSFAPGTWHNIRLVSDGVNANTYFDRSDASTSPGAPTGSPDGGASKAFTLLDLTGASPDMALMNVRWLPGYARNDPLDPTIADPGGPWPTS